MVSSYVSQHGGPRMLNLNGNILALLSGVVLLEFSLCFDIYFLNISCVLLLHYVSRLCPSPSALALPLVPLFPPLSRIYLLFVHICLASSSYTVILPLVFLSFSFLASFYYSFRFSPSCLLFLYISCLVLS